MYVRYLDQVSLLLQQSLISGGILCGLFYSLSGDVNPLPRPWTQVSNVDFYL